MRILMIGGTRFVGKHIVRAALVAGHEVSVFHRGRTGPELFPEAEHLIGDRDNDLSALAHGTWDATIDTCGYVPRQVNELADALAGRGGQYTFISSMSVYAAPPGPGMQEDSPLVELADPTVEAFTGETYGGLKVLCERAARDRYGADELVVRPTYVIGPDDYTWRFPSWVTRIARGGTILAPGPADYPSQYIDGRDMADWVIEMVARRDGGTFHATGPTDQYTWGEELQTIVDAVGPAGTVLEWVDPGFLLEQGVDETALPLWGADDPDRWVMAGDPSAAFANGLRMRPLADTVRDTLEWTTQHTQPTAPGLDADRERELLAAWSSRG